MIRFAAMNVLWTGLAMVVVVALLYVRFERRRARVLVAFAGGLAPRLARAEDDKQRHLRWGLRLVGLLALAIAAAGPRWGEEVVRMSSRGSDLVFVFDTSQSMAARDVPPSRLEEARREALALLEASAGDRIGVVAFAGDAVALTPLTLDHSAVRLLIESLTTDALSTPGSDVGRGLRTALRVLPDEDAGQQAIVLFTDGEDLEGGLEPAIEQVARRGVRVFAVGVGTPAGETIPLLDERGYQTAVKLGTDGQPVVSKLDAPALRGLARRTRGQYFAAPHPGGEIVRLRGALAGVGEGAREGRLGARPVERFPWFALVAWLLFVASWLLPERRTLGVLARLERKPRAARHRAGPGAAAALFIIGGLLAGAPGAFAAHPLVEGNRLYAAGDFKGAMRVYQAALKRTPNDPALTANLGAALYRLGDFKGADDAFARAQGAKDRAVAARAGHGRGNALFRQERYREALDAYRDALEARPQDADARFNYELTLRKLRPENERPNPEQQQPPPPTPGAGGGGSGGGGAQNPARPQPQPSAASPVGGPSEPQDGRGAAGGGALSRAEAERILNAMQEGERQARARQVRGKGTDVPRERDW